MGKGKRSRKQMVSVEEDDLAGLEDVSSDGEDDNYEAELADGETASTGLPTGRRPYRKKAQSMSFTAQHFQHTSIENTFDQIDGLLRN
ncbi:hypothetical protein Vadar_013597 [Vaccinium darrowii]|uniref:Uncharacterized protein n=1 Tax=Vaccinium darrowii TaxID=229202 RepID=A0ACB7YVK8_9ERIC|nr:hypothetical protein Vadar_013597 [Vaccinium darrowii]